jgi:hypothetical protein
MQSALDQIGKLKDLYAYRLNVLKTQADMIGNIIYAILDEEKQKFDQYVKLRGLNIQEQKAETDKWYKSERLKREREKLNMEQQPLIQIKGK